MIGIVVFLAAGFMANTVNAQSDSEDPSESYKKLLSNADQIIKDIRLGRDITENQIAKLENSYRNAFPGSSGGILSDIQGLSASNLNSIDSEEAINKIKDIRAGIVEDGDSEGLGLSFLFKYSHFVILAVSFGLAITVNVINRVAVDWEEVNRVRDKQSELQDKVKEARENNEPKKAHKLQQEQQEFMQEHIGVMFSPMKTMIFIFIPFIIVFNLLSSTYSGWIVAWLPFELPWPDIGFPLLSRFFKGNVAGLGYFGWYMLSYFGFAQFWRKLLVPGR